MKICTFTLGLATFCMAPACAPTAASPPPPVIRHETTRRVTNDDTEPFKEVGRAIEELIARHFYQRLDDSTLRLKERPFSVVFEVGDNGHPDPTPLPNDIKRRLKARFPEIWKDYIEWSDLRYPSLDEKTPDGTKLRGIENSAGDRVYVFHIDKIKYISPDKIEITSYYVDGPSSTNGTTDELSKSKDGWVFVYKGGFGFGPVSPP